MLIFKFYGRCDKILHKWKFCIKKNKHKKLNWNSNIPLRYHGTYSLHLFYLRVFIYQRKSLDHRAATSRTESELPAFSYPQVADPITEDRTGKNYKLNPISWKHRPACLEGPERVKCRTNAVTSKHMKRKLNYYY